MDGSAGRRSAAYWRGIYAGNETVQATSQIPLGTAAQLECGDRVAPFVLPDQDGDPATPVADEVSGKPTLLVFECATGADGATAYANELAAMRDHAEALKESGATVFAITRRRRWRRFP